MTISPLFRKLNLKTEPEICVLQAPTSFEPELQQLDGVRVRRRLPARTEIGFVLAFVTRESEIAEVASRLAAVAPGDSVVWFAYPKRTSKRYVSEISRDTGWNAVGAAGFEPVRMVAIDEDWSALRFRRAGFIKSMKRGSEHALSREGKARTKRT